jgi:hypothetical protein
VDSPDAKRARINAIQSELSEAKALVEARTAALRDEETALMAASWTGLAPVMFQTAYIVAPKSTSDTDDCIIRKYSGAMALIGTYGPLVTAVMESSRPTNVAALIEDAIAVRPETDGVDEVQKRMCNQPLRLYELRTGDNYWDEVKYVAGPPYNSTHSCFDKMTSFIRMTADGAVYPVDC